MVLFALSGCGQGALAPEEIAGEYQATTFTIQLNGVTTEFLSRGATVRLLINGDGTTAGRITVPSVPGVQAEAVDEDLTGSYTISDDLVRLDQATDGSYLDGLVFTADPPELRAYISLTGPNRAGLFTLILTRP